MKTKLLFGILIIAGLITSCGTKTETVPTPAPDSTTVMPPPDYKKTIIAKVYVKPDKVKAFIAAAKVMIENSNKEPGCKGYQLYQDPYESTKFVFVEHYDNQAAVDAHFAADYFNAFGPTIQDMLSQPAEIVIYDVAGEVKK